MTLEKELKKLDPETKIVIGAANGSGWFYIGTAGDIKGIKKAFNDIYKKLPDYIEKNRAKAIKLITAMPDEVKGDEKEAVKYAEKIAGYYSRYMKWKANYNTYVPFERRQVIDSYFKEDRSKAFVINGWESGKWFESDKEGESANVFRKRQHAGE